MMNTTHSGIDSPPKLIDFNSTIILALKKEVYRAMDVDMCLLKLTLVLGSFMIDH